jgi:hypothetical protein
LSIAVITLYVYFVAPGALGFERGGQLEAVKGR